MLFSSKDPVHTFYKDINFKNFLVNLYRNLLHAHSPLGTAHLPSKKYKKEAMVNFNVRLELITIVIAILIALLIQRMIAVAV